MVSSSESSQEVREAMSGSSLEELLQQAVAGADWRDRRLAIIALGYCREPSVQQPTLVKTLIGLLRDPLPEIQQAAVISLGRLGASEAIEELSKPRIVNSLDMRVRWSAISVLRTLGDHRVIETLIAAADDEEWLVRNEALIGLQQKVTDIVASTDENLARILLRMLALKEEPVVSLAISGLVQMGERSIDMVIESMRSPSELVRRNAARVLGEMRNPEAIEPLVAALSDTSEKVHQAASQALVRFGRLATHALLRALEHERNKTPLRTLILTLGEIRDQAAVPHLVKHLSSSYFTVRGAAIAALKPYGTAIVPHLLKMLAVNESDISDLLASVADADNPTVQVRAINALGSLEEHRAVPLLKRLVAGENQEVAEAAQEALVKIGCAAWGRCGALALLGEVGDRSLLPVVERSLRDDSTNVRLEAVRALGKFASEEVIATLGQTALSDPDPYIRTEALRTIRWTGISSTAAVDVALSALSDPDWQVCTQAARLLGNIREERAIQPLLAALRHQNWTVRQSAEDALRNFGTKAVPALIEALDSDDWVVRLRAARALGEIGDPQAIPALQHAVARQDEHPRAKAIAQEALQKLNAAQVQS
ncbi:MAG: HEAT repeat domain-containing protein [bacterium]|jgi:HEAT repeat protein|nr:HEAT repeat domain-containing protein [candidate division KSB1 bacterium]MDH7560535.1 HEAT repeat domain-containing protein [bacterium]